MKIAKILKYLIPAKVLAFLITFFVKLPLNWYTDTHYGYYCPDLGVFIVDFVFWTLIFYFVLKFVIKK